MGNSSFFLNIVGTGQLIPENPFEKRHPEMVRKLSWRFHRQAVVNLLSYGVLLEVHSDQYLPLD